MTDERELINATTSTHSHLCWENSEACVLYFFPRISLGDYAAVTHCSSWLDTVSFIGYLSFPVSVLPYSVHAPCSSQSPACTRVLGTASVSGEHKPCIGINGNNHRQLKAFYLLNFLMLTESTTYFQNDLTKEIQRKQMWQNVENWWI